MYRCELSKISNAGIQIDADLMKSIGVRPGSQCWAVLLDGRRNDRQLPALYSVDKGSKFDPSAQGCHVIVSTVRHEHWLSSARLSIIIEDRPGALEDLLDIIAPRANIELFELAPIGYRHSEVRMVVNFPNFSRWTRERMKKLQTDLVTIKERDGLISELNRVRTEAFREVGELINTLLSALIAEIMLRDAKAAEIDKRKSILCSRFTDLGTSPWFTDIAKVVESRRLFDTLCTGGKITGPDNELQERKKLSSIFFELDRLLSYQNPDEASTFEGVYTRMRGSGQRRPGESESLALSRHFRWREDFLARTWRDAWNPAIRAVPLSHLAYARIWAHQPYALQMVYTSGHELACVDKDGKACGLASLVEGWQAANDDIHGYTKNGIDYLEWPNPPECCHAVVDSDGLWLRFRMLQTGFASAYGIRLNIGFRVLSKGTDRADAQAQGVLSQIITAVSQDGTDVRMGYNDIQMLGSEKGVAITLYIVVGQLAKSRHELDPSNARNELKDQLVADISRVLSNYITPDGLRLIDPKVGHDDWF